MNDIGKADDTAQWQRGAERSAQDEGAIGLDAGGGDPEVSGPRNSAV
jgi:hypothetical protein